MMGSERSSSSSKSPLHNFTLPDGLRWGNQKFLRCMKVNSNGQNSAIQRNPSQFGSSVTNNSCFDKNGFTRSKNDDVYAGYCFEDHRKKRDSWVVPDGVMLPPEKRLKVEEAGGEDGDGIAEVREKVILDLQTAADKMKEAILKRECLGDDGAAEKWNLRTRRGAYGGVSGGGGGKNLNLDVMRNNVEALMVSPLRMVEGEATPRLRSGGTSVTVVGVAASPSGEKKRGKFSVALTRREIEEDFIVMARRRPPRRPMKRPKYIQKQLDTLFPGVWLTEITADMYKVPETQ